MKKFVVIACAAAALTGVFAFTAKDAEARRGYRVVVVTDDGPVYVRRYRVRRYAVQRCGWIERYNRWGEYRGTRRVCAVLPV